MIEDTVKQTRCATCDAEHPYKRGAGTTPSREGRRPVGTFQRGARRETGYRRTADNRDSRSVRRRYDRRWRFSRWRRQRQRDVQRERLERTRSRAGRRRPLVASPPPSPNRLLFGRGTIHQPVPAPSGASDSEIGINASADNRESVADRDSAARPAGDDQPVQDVEDGPVHRQLIRATLPRIEGQKEERRPTDFTIRQPGGRGNNVGNQFRGGGGGGPMRSGRGGHGGNPGNAGHGGNAGHRGNGHRPPGGPRVCRGAVGPGLRSGPGARPRARPGRRFQAGPAAQAGRQPEAFALADLTLFCHLCGHCA